MTQKLKFVLVRIKNVVGKGENASYKLITSWKKEKMLGTRIFFFFPKCFQNAFFSGLLKFRIVWERAHSSPCEKNVHMSKLISFVYDDISLSQIMKFVFERGENIVGKGKKLFTSMFPIGIFLRVVRTGDRVVESYSMHGLLAQV